MLHIEKVFEDMARGLASHEIQFRADWGADDKTLVVTAPEFGRRHVLVEPPSQMLRGVVTMNGRKWVGVLLGERKRREEAANRPPAKAAAPAAAFMEHNGELRIRDLTVAECLEAAKPKNIRGNLIKPYREKLERHGPLVTEPIERGPKGGRPGTTYFLNRMQALVLCELSRGGRSCRGRDRVIELFDRAEAERRAPEPQPAEVKPDDPAEPFAHIDERFDHIEKRIWVLERMLRERNAAGLEATKVFAAELGRVSETLTGIKQLILSRFSAAQRDDGALADMRRNIRAAMALLERNIAD